MGTNRKIRQGVILLFAVLELCCNWALAVMTYTGSSAAAAYWEGKTLSKSTIGAMGGRSLPFKTEAGVYTLSALLASAKFFAIILIYFAPNTIPFVKKVQQDYFNRVFGIFDFATIVLLGLDVICFSFPSAVEIALLGTLVCTRLILLLRYRSLKTESAIGRDIILEYRKHKNDPVKSMHLVHLLRERHYILWAQSECAFSSVVGLITSLFLINAIYYSWQNLSQINKGGFFSVERMDEMLENFNRSYLVGNDGVPLTDRRVVINVLDGLRNDFVSRNQDFANFVKTTNSTYPGRVFHKKISASLPSMSVPNWVVTITGTRPELSGVFGNLQIPELSLDSIYARADNIKLPDGNKYMRGIVGSPWFPALVESRLLGLEGDCRVATSFGLNGGPDRNATLADERRWRIAKFALNRTDNPYRLWLSHYSDIDQQGHLCGVTPEKNRCGDSYNFAVSKKAAIVADTVATLASQQYYKNNTVFIITADHGHVDSGGHGGIDPLLRAIPLIVWQTHPDITDYNPYPDLKFDMDQDNTFLAPTVAALLGLPVPAQSQGVFIDELMPLINTSGHLSRHLEDLFRQKQFFTGRFFVDAGLTNEQLDRYAENPLFGITAETYNKTDSEFIQATKDIINIFEQERLNCLHRLIVRNWFCSLAVVGMLGYVGLLHLVKNTLAFPFFLLQCCARHGKQPQGDAEKHFANIRVQNWEAMWVAALNIFVYLLVVVVVYLIVYTGLGYEDWDSTVMHHPDAIKKYWVWIVLVPGILLQAVISRVVMYPFVRKDSKSCNGDLKHKCLCLYRTIAALCCLEFRVSSKRYVRQDSLHYIKLQDMAPAAEQQQPGPAGAITWKQHIAALTKGNWISKRERGVGFQYLVRIYMALWGLVLMLTLLMLECPFGTAIPYIYDVQLLDNYKWVYRYRILSVELMLSASMIYNLIALMLWPRLQIFTETFDELMYFAALKAFIIAEFSGKSADVWECTLALLSSEMRVAVSNNDNNEGGKAGAAAAKDADMPDPDVEVDDELENGGLVPVVSGQGSLQNASAPPQSTSSTLGPLGGGGGGQQQQQQQQQQRWTKKRVVETNIEELLSFSNDGVVVGDDQEKKQQ